MTDLQSWVAPTYDRLADLLAVAAVETWDAPSLCEKWLVRHVIAHVTMPARLPHVSTMKLIPRTLTSKTRLSPLPRGADA